MHTRQGEDGELVRDFAQIATGLRSCQETQHTLASPHASTMVFELDALSVLMSDKLSKYGTVSSPATKSELPKNTKQAAADVRSAAGTAETAARSADAGAYGAARSSASGR